MATQTKQKKRASYGDVFSDEPIDDLVKDHKEKTKNMGGKYPVYLDVKDGEEVTVRFLDKDPVKFWQHRVWDGQSKKGKGGYRVFSCTRGSDCPLCSAGDKPSFKVAWQVVHVDALDKDGNVTPRVKLFVKGIRFAEYYAKKSEKKDPTKQNVVIERIGSDQNTSYGFSEWGDKAMPEYDQEECVDLEEHFGLDDEKFAEMERIAGSIDAPSGKEDKGYSGPKKGGKSRLEKNNDEDDDDIPF